MLGAGLLAKKAVERGLTVNPAVKTSLGPGSRVVTDYLNKTGLSQYLDTLGFQTVGYGCTTCIGNSGPLHPALEEAIAKNDLVAASVLSGNRNFEARVHQNIKANFLMSPPLVVAFALAGTVDIDLSKRPARHQQGRRSRLSQGHLAEPRRNSRSHVQRPQARSLPPALHRLRHAKSEVERDPIIRRRSLRVGREIHLHPGAAVLRRFRHGARSHQRNQGRQAAWHLRRFGHDRSYQPRRSDQEDQPRRQSFSKKTASRRTTSTATARAAATTAS